MSSNTEAPASGREFQGRFVLTVAGSGGGLGATALAVDLAALFAGREYETALVDADATVPAAGARLDVVWGDAARLAAVQPGIDHGRCQRCGACSDFCAFEALALLHAGIRYTPDSCVGCGGCRRVCPSGAISEQHRPLGTLRRGNAGPNLSVFEAELSPDARPWDAAMTAQLRKAARDIPVQIVRAVTGTGRAAREAWRGADLVLWLDDLAPGADPAPLPGIDAANVIRISSRSPDAGAPGVPFTFPESGSIASQLARSGRFLLPASPWFGAVYYILSTILSSPPFANAAARGPS